MALFKRKQKQYLGIDFGATGIKVVQLQGENGRGKLFTYGILEFISEETGVEYVENHEKASALLKSVCARARITIHEAVAALPMPSVFSAVLSLSAVPKKELRQAVEWEAKKLIPFPLEEVTLDFRELTRNTEAKSEAADSKKSPDDSGQSLPILLTAAPNAIIEKYMSIAKGAGLTLGALETEAFALIRALLDNDPTPTVIVDMGALRSNILMVDRGIPMLTRSVQIGGKKCTEVIAQELGVTETEAETMKRDFSLSGNLGRGSSGALPDIIKEVLAPLVNELKYSFNVYRTRNVVARNPERIVLTGGSAEMPGLAEFFAAEFNLRTFLGNPWNKVDAHPDLRKVLQKMGTRFAVAIGLALRNI